MPLEDITDIIDRTWYWIVKSDGSKVLQKIDAAYFQRGCWEGWAQVEIAYLVALKYGQRVAIEREVNVYSDVNKANDFVITDKLNATKPKQIVELKCERGTQTPTQFRDAFLKDILKIQQYPIKPLYRPAKSYALAISVTQESYDLLVKLEGVKRVQCIDTA